MDTRTRTQLLALFAAGTVMLAAGCDQRNASSPSSSTATPPTSSSTATTTDKMASSANRAGDKMASAANTTGDKIDDAALTTKVKTALMAEPGLRSLEINVDTRDNVVTLNGTVDTQEKKQRAMQIAQGVDGVKSVSDNLVVKSS
jgi:hyperosmotically inducible periplasmic protein